MPGLTYAWLAMPRLLDAEKDARVEAPEFRARMQQALDKELASKGYRLASGGSNADFLMAWRAGVRDVDQVSLADSPDTATEVPQAGIACDGHGCSQLVMVGEAGAPEPRVQTYHHLEGGLLVEAVEPGSVRLLWSAYNRGTVHTGEGSQSGLDVIATETLERFPESNR